MRWSLRNFAAAFCIALTSFTAANAGPINVAIVHVGTDENGIFGASNALTFLSADPRFASVGEFNVDVTGLPTLNQLDGFQAIMVTTDNRDGTITGGGLGTQLGDLLLSYVNGGGRLVMTAFTGNGGIGIDGGILSVAPFASLSSLNGAAGPLAVGATPPELWNGVSSFTSTFASHITLTPGGIDLANYTSSEIGVASNATGSFLFINAFPYDQSDYSNGTNFGLLFANALAVQATIGVVPTPTPGSPEPASIALFGAGLSAVGLLRRRKKA